MLDREIKRRVGAEILQDEAGDARAGALVQGRRGSRGSGAADMMSLYTTVPTKGAGALGPRRKRPAGLSLPEGRATRAKRERGGTSREAASDAGAEEGADVAGAGPTRLDLRGQSALPWGREAGADCTLPPGGEGRLARSASGAGTSREAASGAGVRRGADVAGAGPHPARPAVSPPSPEGREAGRVTGRVAP